MTGGNVIGMLAWLGVLTLLGGWVGFAVFAGFVLLAVALNHEWRSR